jgi:hypothetical protein
MPFERVLRVARRRAGLRLRTSEDVCAWRLFGAPDALEPSMGAYMDAARWASDELDRVERRMQSYIRPVQRRAPVALMNFREGSPHLA